MEMGVIINLHDFQINKAMLCFEWFKNNEHNG